MSKDFRIEQINKVLKDYFRTNPHSAPVPAKDFMPQFIDHGIFNKDHRNGLPIRNLLRQLDADGDLDLIPFVVAERRSKNTFWYFAPLTA